MGWRFHKSFGLLPGLKINLSKSGGSVSVGRPGMTYNIGPNGTRATVGLPGSGVSYSQSSSGRRNTSSGKRLMGWFVLILALAVLAYKNQDAIMAMWPQ